MSEHLDHRASPRTERRRAIPPDPEAVRAAYRATPSPAGSRSLRRLAVGAAIFGVLSTVAVPGAREAVRATQERAVEFDLVRLRSRQKVTVDVELTRYDRALASLVVVPVYRVRGDREDGVLLAEKAIREHADRIREAIRDWAAPCSRTALMQAGSELRLLADGLQARVFPNDEAMLTGLDVRSLEFN